MRGWMIAGALAAAVVASVVACARPEPLARPSVKAKGRSPAEEAARNRHVVLLEQRSRWVPSLDPRQPARATPARMTAVMPPVPVLLPLVRPALRDDALVLADRALAMGDALDAAAQYRALLGRRDRAIAGYVNVQLARAYTALGDLSRADEALRAAMLSPDTAWHALAQLATLRARRMPPGQLLKQLGPLAARRIGELENVLVHAVAPEDAAEILMAKAERDPDAPDACGYALAAVARGYVRMPKRLDATCRLEVERAIAEALGMTWLDARNPCRRLLGANAAGWRQAERSGELAPWLAIAERAVEALDVAQNADDERVARSMATVALINVLRLAFRGAAVDDVTLDRFRAVADALPPPWRDPLRDLALPDPRFAPHVLATAPQPGAP